MANKSLPSASTALTGVEVGYHAYKYCKGDIDGKEFTKESTKAVAGTAAAAAATVLIGGPVAVTGLVAISTSYAVGKAIDSLCDLFDW